MKKNKQVLKTVSVVLTSLLMFASCEIGLGEAVDIEAPKVVIETPQPTAIVQKELMIRGSVTDNIGVTELEVMLEARDFETLKYKWDGSWKKLENNEWKACDEAKMDGNPKSLSYSIPISIPGLIQKKEFTLTTTAKDEYGNQSQNSSDSRLITVDGVEPSATVSVGKALMTNFAEAEAVYAASKLQDNSILEKLVNGNFVIKVNQKENTRLGKFTLIIDTGVDTVIPSISDVPDLSSLPNVYKAEIDSSSRSFEINVDRSSLSSSIQNGKHLLRILTESLDEGGNLERKVQGFFIYYHEADKPWTEMSLGDTELKEGQDQKEVYPSCQLQGYAYDDDGLSSVKLELYIYENNQWVLDDIRTQNIDLTDEDFPKNKVWSIYAIADSKHFKVVSKCVDINGVESDSLEKFFRISDVNPPKLIIDAPPSGDVVLGAAVGDELSVGTFTITGKVEDDGQVRSLKMLRIANKNKSDFMKYFNGGYDGWKTPEAASADGNKLFDIPLVGTGIPEGGYCKYTFTKDFNIFTDFGINGTGTRIVETPAGDGKIDVSIESVYTTENIKSQNFLFRIEDESGAVAIETFSLQGDVEPPVLTLEKVHVAHKTGSTWNKDGAVAHALNSDQALPTYERDSTTNEITDKIYFSGIWSDNAVTRWGDVSKIGEIYLYNSKGRVANVTMKSGGTWESELIVPEDSTTASVQAMLTDWGGNTVKASGSYFVSSSKPTLIRITSTNPDGTYKNGDELTLVMEYNKKVTFKGDVDNSPKPYLILNNDGVAEYLSGNGESKHYYKYVVGRPGEKAISATTKLKVKELKTNGNSWKDNDDDVIDTSTLTGFNLDDVRSIYLDNANPRLVKIIPVTGEGYYRKGKELFFQAEFNKPVTIKDLDKVKIKLNISGTGKTETEIKAISVPSSTTALFKYTVDENDNTFDNPSVPDPVPEPVPCKLKVTGFTGGADNIFDVANNPMSDFTATDTTNYFDAGKIYIDTTAPKAPVVSGIENNKLYYSDISSITFADFEDSTAATRYYSFDGGNSWIQYTGTSPVIEQNGTNKVCAKQVDNAGNESPISNIITVTLDKGNLLSAISTNEPDGTYKKGQSITFVLKFRKEVSASGVKLNLNITDSSGNTLNRQANLTDSTEPDKLKFIYTVDVNDKCEGLNVTKVDCSGGWIKDKFGTVVTSNVDYSAISDLKASRTIKIVNGKPTVTNPDTNITLTKTTGKERELRIKFNSEITKQTRDAAGNDLYIILKQEKGFEAPAILTESQWAEYPAEVTKYYKETTNGWNKDTGAPDLSTKYVLKYKYNTDGTSDDNEDNITLITGLTGIYNDGKKNLSPDTVPVPMGSNYVYVDDTDKSVLVVSLKDDYTLPVQGADYTLTIPAGIVENFIQERNEEIKSTTETTAINKTSFVRKNPGVETPVIRINKVSESISETTITQHPKTKFKVDCQTGNVTIKLRKKESTPQYLHLMNNKATADNIYGFDDNNDIDVVLKRNGDVSQSVSTAPAFGISVSALEDGGTIAKKSESEIGNDINPSAEGFSVTSITGYKILIEATAEDNANASNKSLPAYESAMRTVVILTEKKRDGTADENKISDAVYKKNRWLRGGDNTSGGVSTADFPLSWDSKDWNKSPRHIRAMSPIKSDDNNAKWYWITWNINATSYVHFLAGDITKKSDEYGPSKWWWSSCGWTGQKTQTPVYAGECTYFDTAANRRYWTYAYLQGGDDGEKHRESRPTQTGE